MGWSGVGAEGAGFTIRVPWEFEVAPLHARGIEEQETTDESLADAGEHLDGFHGLDRTDDSDKRRHDAIAGATRIEFTELRIQAMVARAGGNVGIEGGDLSLHADGGGGNQRLAPGDAGGVDGETGFEIVAGVEHEVGPGHRRIEAVALQALADRGHGNIGIEAEQPVPGGIDLGLAERFFGMGDLALQIGQLNDIVIGDQQMADAGRGKIHGRGAAEPAHADNENGGVHELALSRHVHFGQQDLAAEAQQLLFIHRLAALGMARPGKLGIIVEYVGPPSFCLGPSGPSYSHTGRWCSLFGWMDRIRSAD